jgi:hypothetical protein
MLPQLAAHVEELKHLLRDHHPQRRQIQSQPKDNARAPVAPAAGWATEGLGYFSILPPSRSPIFRLSRKGCLSALGFHYRDQARPAVRNITPEHGF